MDDHFDIAIAGGSFVGLTLAIALDRASRGGLRIGVIDPAPVGEIGELPTDPRASALSAASRRVLDGIGIWTELADHAQPVLHIDITDGPLDSPVRQVLVSYDNVTAEGEPASYIVENERLRQAIAAALRECTSIHVLSGERVVHYQAGPHVAELRLSSGARLSVLLAVAADGRRSALRDLAAIKIVGWTYDQTGIVTTLAHERPHGARAVQHFLPAGPFAILPLHGGHRSSLVWTEHTEVARHMLALDDAAFLAAIEQRFGGRLGPLQLDGGRASWPLEMHLARSFRAPRLALAGDAARGVHPIAGQGLNIGLRDVAALAELVIDASRLGLDLGNAELLSQYERWRRFDSVSSAAAMDGLNRLFSNDNPMVRAFRDFGLGLVERAPLVKRALVQEAAGLSGSVPRLVRGEAL